MQTINKLLSALTDNQMRFIAFAFIVFFWWAIVKNLLAAIASQ